MPGNDDIALTLERQAAARLLLAAPLLTPATHPEGFELVHAHADWLIRRFRVLLDYRLTVTADHARLAKSGLVDSVATPLRRESGTTFTPRAYANLVLCLAALADLPDEPTVREIADGTLRVARDAGLGIDPTDRMAGRRPFVAALHRLRAWGVIAGPIDALTEYARVGAGDDRFRVNRAAARTLLSRPPRAAGDAESFLATVRGEETGSDPDAPADRAAVAVLRRLAEHAVVYRADLPEAQATWLRQHQWRAVTELGHLLGCTAEVRAEGVALVVSDGADGFPNRDAAGRRALRVLRHLAAAVPVRQVPVTEVTVPDALLDRALRAEGEDGGPGDTVTPPDPEPDAPAPTDRPRPALSARDAGDERVLRLLAEHDLLVRGGGPEEGGGWRLRAAAARYAVPDLPAAGDGDTPASHHDQPEQSDSLDQPAEPETPEAEELEQPEKPEQPEEPGASADDEV